MLDLVVAEVSPHPAGQVLELPIRCYVDPEHKRLRTHPILLHPDWTVDTGHDLEAERFTVAFGGYLSCLALADAVVPAVRTYLRRQLRLESPELHVTVGRRWRPVRRVERCCAASTLFNSAPEAAKHLRSARHIAAEYGARATAVSALAKRVLAVHGLTDPVPPPAGAMQLVGRVVPSPTDVLELWEAGLTPGAVQELHERVDDGRLLPASFFFGLLTGRPDLQTLGRVPMPDKPRPEPIAIPMAWRGLGASQRDVVTLLASPYEPRDVRELSRELRVSTTSAAFILATWTSAGCLAPVPDLVAVCEVADAGPLAVTRGSVDRLSELLTRQKIPATRESMGLALVLCGSPPLAAHVIRAVGSLDPGEISRGLQEWELARRGCA